MLGPEAPLGANNAKHPYSGVGMLWALLGEQQLSRLSEHQPTATAIGQLPLQQIVLIAERLQAGPLPCLGEQFAIEIGERQEGRAAFVALHQALKLERSDLGFTGLDRLIANAQWKAIAGHLHWAVGARHVEDHQFLPINGNQKSRGLRGL